MSRVCHFTGKRTVAGRSIARRGKAKYLGGVGKKITGKTKRKFKPNIQTVTAVVDGRPQRVKVSTKALPQSAKLLKCPRRLCLQEQSFPRCPRNVFQNDLFKRSSIVGDFPRGRLIFSHSFRPHVSCRCCFQIARP